MIMTPKDNFICIAYDYNTIFYTGDDSWQWRHGHRNEFWFPGRYIMSETIDVHLF